MECKKSYDFVEPPLVYPKEIFEQSRNDGLYFEWVGLCKNNTLTFGKESGNSCEILLSFEIYPDNNAIKKFHSNPNLSEYWKHARNYLQELKKVTPQLYYEIVDLLIKYDLEVLL